MDIDLSALPDDVAALKAVVIAACAKADAVAAELANEQARRADDAALIAHMKLQIEKLKRDKFGPRSERASRLLDQMEFELEELEGTATEDELAAGEAAARTTNVTAFHPQTACAQAVPRASAARARCCARTDLLRLLRRHAAVQARRRRHRDPRSHSPAVESHPARAREIHLPRLREHRPGPGTLPRHPRGWAGPSFLAMLVFEKFGQHQPLNRQAERYAREGVPAEPVDARRPGGRLLHGAEPDVRALEAHVLAAERLHGDDTTVPVLAKGKTVTGRCWVYVRDDRPFGGTGAAGGGVLLLARSPRRASAAHLASYAGILQADAYGGYNELYDPTEAGANYRGACWAHAPAEIFRTCRYCRNRQAQGQGASPLVVSPMALEAVQPHRCAV